MWYDVIWCDDVIWCVKLKNVFNNTWLNNIEHTWTYSGVHEISWDDIGRYCMILQDIARTGIRGNVQKQMSDLPQQPRGINWGFRQHWWSMQSFAVQWYTPWCFSASWPNAAFHDFPALYITISSFVLRCSERYLHFLCSAQCAAMRLPLRRCRWVMQVSNVATHWARMKWKGWWDRLYPTLMAWLRLSHIKSSSVVAGKMGNSILIPLIPT